MTQWTYHNPTKVVYQPGALATLKSHLPFQHIVLVTTAGFRRRGVVDRVVNALGDAVIAVIDDVQPNPDILAVDQQLLRLRHLPVDALLALGGGSSIDTAKALAKMLPQEPELSLARHFREQQPLSNTPALPVVAIPTTSGTGAEVTPFGTLWDAERAKKYSIGGNDLFPRLAIVDSELTYGLPQEVTVSSGLDAVSHALESVWNHHANPVTLGFATESLRLSLPALQVLTHKPDDHLARAHIMQASLLAGLAISQTRTALAHSISYPLTAQFGLPHGIACSFTLPALLRFNATADDGRLQRLATALGNNTVDDMANALDDLFIQAGGAEIFARYVPDLTAVMQLTTAMFTPGRADNNIRTATHEDVQRIVRQAAAYTLSNTSAIK